MIKAVLFDIDGTLVSFNTHKVPQSTIQALDELKKKGIKVFISTGRQYGSIDNLGDLQFDGYITLNGGYCMAGTDKVIYKHSIAEEDIDALLEYEKEKGTFPCSFVTDEGIFLNYKDDKVEEVFRLINFPEPPKQPLQYMKGRTVYQLLAFFGPGEEDNSVMTVLRHCESTRWNPLFADIIPAGSNKGVGVDKIIEYFGISLDETMAFGDGGNDILMLQHVGIGVAMGNAGDEVKKKADYVTASVDEDGVYKALKHFNAI